ncbi:unnamed protein product [Rhodiola kirilowii]
MGVLSHKKYTKHFSISFLISPEQNIRLALHSPLRLRTPIAAAARRLLPPRSASRVHGISYPSLPRSSI